MKTHYETIVVGAGAAGMNCCLELQKNDREYLLISPNIGGRICNDEERHMNYGAVFYFGTYKYMLRSELLIEGPDVLPALSAGCCHHDNGKQYEPVSPTTIADAPSLLKYMKWMREEFIPRYTKFKDNCTVMEVTAALEKDPPDQAAVPRISNGYDRANGFWSHRPRSDQHVRSRVYGNKDQGPHRP